MPRDPRTTRDLHAFDGHGMILCNPRDREAALRGETEGIATDDQAAVTCPSCLRLLHRQAREERMTHGGGEGRPTEPHAGLPVGTTLTRVRSAASMVGSPRAGDGLDPQGGGAPPTVGERATEARPWSPQTGWSGIPRETSEHVSR